MLLPGAASVAASSPNCTPQQGQDFIDAGQLTQAIHEFTCVIDAERTEVDGYRGRAEALLLLGRFSDAYHDYNTGITALVVPLHRMPSARSTTTTPLGCRSIRTRSRPSPGRASRVG